jgi:hypothetical protein
MTGRNQMIAKFSFAVAVALVGLTVSGMAQQNTTFKVPHSAPEKAPKSTVPPGHAANTATASAENSKDLQSIERGAAKSPAPTSAKKTPAPALAPAKEEPSTANGGSNTAPTVAHKSTPATNPDANPLRGRLRDKYDTRQKPN